MYLLLEEWDAERGVTRESRYASFDPYRKLDFLATFAHRLVLRKGSGLAFTAAELREIYLSICDRFALPPGDADAVCREIESHTGIIVKATFDTYEFSHKSLQEFLVAEHLVRLRDIPSATRLLHNCPNELAVAVALSADATDFFCGLFRDKGRQFDPKRIKPSSEFLTVFLSRVADEKPGLEGSAEFGGACLWLFSRCQEAVLDGRIRRFVGLDSVRRGLDAFLARANLRTGHHVTIELRERFEADYPVVQTIDFPRDVAECIPALKDRITPTPAG